MNEAEIKALVEERDTLKAAMTTLVVEHEKLRIKYGLLVNITKDVEKVVEGLSGLAKVVSAIKEAAKAKEG